MWRFIVITFAFLGWSFYELSGGSDYEPRVQSIQARAKLDDVRPQARPVRVNVIRIASDIPGADDTAPVTRTLGSLADYGPARDDAFEVSLASTTADLASGDVSVPTTARRDPAKAAPATRAPRSENPGPDAAALPNLPRMSESTAKAVERASLANLVTAPAVPAAADPAAPPGQDIRRVTGDLVNMRDGPGTSYDRIGRLTKGTEVIVLEETGGGWIKLRVADTGRIGWMADWLVAASN